MQGLKIRLLSYFFRIHQTNIHIETRYTHTYTYVQTHTYTHILSYMQIHINKTTHKHTHDCFRQTPVLMARWNSYSQHSPTPSCQNHCSFWTSCKRTAALQCTSTHMHTHIRATLPAKTTAVSERHVSGQQHYSAQAHTCTHTHIRATLPAKPTAVSGRHVRGQQRVNQRLTGHQAD
jgi:hypothetical protein